MLMSVNGEVLSCGHRPARAGVRYFPCRRLVSHRSRSNERSKS